MQTRGWDLVILPFPCMMTMIDSEQHHTGKDARDMADWKYCPVCQSRLVEKTVEGKRRMACPEDSCDFIHWDPPVPIVAGIVQHQGNIILARNKTWPEKMFGLITGFLEKDETPEAGIVREVEEELGVSGRAVHLVGLYPFAMMNQLIIAYHIETEGEIQLGEELAEIKSVSPRKLKPWDFGTGLAVRDWLDSKKV